MRHRKACCPLSLVSLTSSTFERMVWIVQRVQTVIFSESGKSLLVRTDYCPLCCRGFFLWLVWVLWGPLMLEFSSESFWFFSLYCQAAFFLDVQQFSSEAKEEKGIDLLCRYTSLMTNINLPCEKQNTDSRVSGTCPCQLFILSSKRKPYMFVWMLQVIWLNVIYSNCLREHVRTVCCCRQCHI